MRILKYIFAMAAVITMSCSSVLQAQTKTDNNMKSVIRTFLDNYGEQLKGKVILPFCTSYESPMSEADATLKKGYPSLKIRKGLRLPAKSEEIKKWIKQ